MVAQCETLGALCRALHEHAAGTYPQCYYDLKAYGSIPHGGNAAYLPQLIFDYWGNSEDRYAILEKHGFDPYSREKDVATLPLSDFKKLLVPALVPKPRAPMAKAPKQSVIQLEDDLTIKVRQYAQAVWDAVANLWGAQSLAQSTLRDRAGLAAKTLAMDAIAKVVTGPQAAVPDANAIRDRVAELLPKLEVAIREAPISGALTAASPPSLLPSTPGGGGKRRPAGMNPLTASLFAGSGPAVLPPGRLTRTEDAIAEIKNQGRILHELLVEGKSATLKVDGYETYGELIKDWITKHFFEASGERNEQPSPRATGVLEILTHVMAHGFYAKADHPDFGDDPSEPDYLSVLESVPAEPAPIALNIKAETPFAALLSFCGKSAGFVVKAGTVAGSAVGNLSGPPSLWVAMKVTGATRAFAELGTRIEAVRGITKAGGFSESDVKVYRREYMALEARINATMPKEAADEINYALMRRDHKKANALLNQHAGSAVHSSLRWKAAAGVFAILSLCASFADLVEKWDGRHDPTKPMYARAMSFGGAVISTAGSAGLVTIGSLEIYVQWHSGLCGAALKSAGILGGVCGLLTSIGGLMSNGLAYAEAYKDADGRKMLLSGLGVVGNFGFVAVSLYCLLEGSATLATGPVGIAVLAFIVAQGVLDFALSAWDAAHGISVTDVNRVLVALTESIATSSAGEHLAKTDSDAKRVLDDLLGLAKTGWLPVAARSDANKAELEKAGLASPIFELICPNPTPWMLPGDDGSRLPNNII